jgi:hypothetical protein
VSVETVGKFKRSAMIEISTAVQVAYVDYLTRTGDEPIYVYMGHDQWNALHRELEKYGVASLNESQTPRYMGMELLTVDRDDFLRVSI